MAIYNPKNILQSRSDSRIPSSFGTIPVSLVKITSADSIDIREALFIYLAESLRYNLNFLIPFDYVRSPGFGKRKYITENCIVLFVPKNNQ